MSRSRIKPFLLLASIFIFLSGCSGLEDSEKEKLRKANATGETIYRSKDEVLFVTEGLKQFIREKYPWENTLVAGLPRITKDFFCCKGSHENAPVIKTVAEQFVYTFDCGGPTQHSLPYRERKEHIYPALLELLNYLQEKTQRRVIVTCGHRCPTHNTYADPSHFNQTSKHMIGAEVDFYIKGFEWRPRTIINLLKEYYEEHPTFKEDSKFTLFERYEKETNVSTRPWHNKEIFIKLYKKDEGRDMDNNHNYPYFSIQLKWDRDQKEPITYSWTKAFNSYLRY